MNNIKKPKKFLINWHIFFARLKTRWSFVAWLLAAVLAIVIYFHGGRFGGMRGSVFTRIQTTAPLVTGQLIALHVDVGDVVRQGDLLAQMDSTELEAEKSLMAAQMNNMLAEIQTEEVQNLRRFDASIIRLESELRELRLKQTEATSELEALRPEFERMEKLFKSQLIEEQELMPLRMQILSLETITKIYPDAIKQVETSLTEARAQKASISEQSLTATALIEKEATEQARLFDVQIESCNLRAQQDCTVSRIYFFPGDIVSEGNPVLASVVQGEPRIIGFLSEYNARDVEVGMKAYLTPVSGHGPIVEASVMAMTPEIYTLPDRASPMLGQVSRGRRVVLSADPGCGLLPGESVDVHFSRPWTTRVLWSIFGGKSEGEL